MPIRGPSSPQKPLVYMSDPRYYQLISLELYDFYAQSDVNQSEHVFSKVTTYGDDHLSFVHLLLNTPPQNGSQSDQLEKINYNTNIRDQFNKISYNEYNTLPTVETIPWWLWLTTTQYNHSCIMRKIQNALTCALTLPEWHALQPEYLELRTQYNQLNAIYASYTPAAKNCEKMILSHLKDHGIDASSHDATHLFKESAGLQSSIILSVQKDELKASHQALSKQYELNKDHCVPPNAKMTLNDTFQCIDIVDLLSDGKIWERSAFNKITI